METYSGETGGERQAPQAVQVSMEDFIATATRAVLLGLERAGLNPQPLPPKEETPSSELNPQPEPPGEAAAPLNPQPLPPFDIIVGVMLRTSEEIVVTRGSKI